MSLFDKLQKEFKAREEQLMLVGATALIAGAYAVSMLSIYQTGYIRGTTEVLNTLKEVAKHSAN